MEFNDYQKAANRTLYGNEQVLTNCALGLAGETGQVVDLEAFAKKLLEIQRRG